MFFEWILEDDIDVGNDPPVCHIPKEIQYVEALMVGHLKILGFNVVPYLSDRFKHYKNTEFPGYMIELSPVHIKHKCLPGATAHSFGNSIMDFLSKSKKTKNLVQVLPSDIPLTISSFSYGYLDTDPCLITCFLAQI
jgi:hypothetical protein